MNTRQIQTTGEQAACDVCGRTLLRGERAEVYLSGGSRRSVCELCTTRALHEGWVREGTVPETSARDSGSDRRRSLLGRLRTRRDVGAEATRQPPGPASERRPGGHPDPDPIREPRHVRAIPTSPEQRVASAVDAFNGSEHCRTIAGVSRSLGPAAVSVWPSTDRASVVGVTVSWELCWYRYEIDLSDDDLGVRLAGQGYELGDLAAHELEPNAAADDRGRVMLA